MQVKELESKGLQKTFSITVDAAQINTQTETELKAAGSRIKIPGFRPGNIPMKVLQQRYGKSVQGDVIKQVINQSSNDVITKNSIRPVMMPKININDYKEGGDLTYTMTVESFPTVPDTNFDKLTLNRNTFDVTEKDIDEAVERVAAGNPKLVPAKDGAKAALENVVQIDFKGSVGGKVFDGGTAEDFKLELGSGRFIEGFEDQLVGSKAGDDKIVTVTFPVEYPAKNLAGKEAQFAVKIKEILVKENPAIDEEFAKSLGFADLAAVRGAIKEQLTKEYDQLIRRQLKKDLFDALEEGYNFELPQTMIEAEFNSIWERLKQAKAENDPSVAGKSDEELKAEYQKIAERRVKLGILLAEVGTRNQIQVSRDELGTAVIGQARQYPGQEKQIMEFYRDHPERLEELRGPILEEKAVDFILGKIKFTDSKKTLNELMEMDAEGEEAASGSEKKAKKKAKSESDEGGTTKTSKAKKKSA